MDPKEKVAKKACGKESKPNKLVEKKEIFDPKEHEVNKLFWLNMNFNNLFPGVLKIHLQVWRRTVCYGEK